MPLHVAREIYHAVATQPGFHALGETPGYHEPTGVYRTEDDDGWVFDDDIGDLLVVYDDGSTGDGLDPGGTEPDDRHSTRTWHRHRTWAGGFTRYPVDGSKDCSQY